MTRTPGATGRWRWWRWTELVERPSPLAKQLPTVALLFIGILVVLTPAGTEFTSIFDAGAAIAIVGVATVLSVVFTIQRRWEGWAVMVVPMLDILGLGLFRAATGGTASLFGGFLILPVIWLASAPRRRYIAVAALLSSLSLLLPFFRDPPSDWEQWLRGVVTPLVFTMVAVAVNELTRLLRRRAELAERFAADREAALRETEELIAQLQESEQRYLRLLGTFESVWNATTAQAVISTDLDGRVDAWNPGAVRLFGRAADEVVERLRVAELFPPKALALLADDADGADGAQPEDPVPAGLRRLFRLAAGGEPVERELDLFGAHGEPFPMRLTVTARRDPAGELIGYLLVATDETRAVEVMRMKDEFVGMISHELRTPLSSILGYLDLLADDTAEPLSDEQRRFVGVIERNANRLLKLVSDLLFAAQVDSGRFPLDLHEVDIVPIIAAAVESARPSAEHAGIDLVADLPASAPPILLDPERIGQAIDNLLSNAIKFSRSGGRVVVSLAVGSASLTVAVRDTGIGIPQDEMGRLFTRFFRASTAMRNSVPGIGLGLVITKAIVVAHGGWMDVDSEPGVGTEFKFSLQRSREGRDGRMPAATA